MSRRKQQNPQHLQASDEDLSPQTKSGEWILKFFSCDLWIVKVSFYTCLIWRERWARGLRYWNVLLTAERVSHCSLLTHVVLGIQCMKRTRWHASLGTDHTRGGDTLSTRSDTCSIYLWISISKVVKFLCVACLVTLSRRKSQTHFPRWVCIFLDFCFQKQQHSWHQWQHWHDNPCLNIKIGHPFIRNLFENVQPMTGRKRYTKHPSVLAYSRRSWLVISRGHYIFIPCRTIIL
jgi:hypothetical protein